METVIEHIGGAGINGEYRVVRDGVHVANIRRTGQGTRWGLYSVYYRNALAGASDVASAKRMAWGWERYPTEHDVYETICTQIEWIRRKWKRAHSATMLAELAGALASGNGQGQAVADLIHLHEEIERFAKDRSDIGNQQYLSRSVDYFGDAPTYPKPPTKDETGE